MNTFATKVLMNNQKRLTNNREITYFYFITFIE